MKILVIHNYYLEKGGEDNAVLAEINLLREYGNEVVIYKKKNQDLEKESFFRKLMFLIFEMEFSKKVYREVKGLLKSEKPDVAHVHNVFVNITPSIYKALNDEGIPIVQSLHNYKFFCLKATFFRRGFICEKCKNSKFFKGVLRRCWRDSAVLSYFLSRTIRKLSSFIKYIDTFIALSNFSKNKFVELGLEEQRIFVKKNFMEIGQITEGEKADQDFALFVGRLVDYKGVKTLIDAFKAKPLLKLKIVGEGPLRNLVQDYISSHNNVQWLGELSRDAVFEEISKSSFSIFASECYETMGLVIMESFAFSKPVLASNLGGVKEFIIDGLNGLLFNPGDVVDLAAKADYLFSHKKERMKMGENANKVYKEQFDKEKNYRDLINIYSETIKLSRIKPRLI